MVSHRKAIGALALALPWLAAAAAGEGAAPAPEGGVASAEGPAQDARSGETHDWLLEEFDWGDDEEVVAESVMFDPHFGCKGTAVNPCILVSTVIDREQLLARFHHYKGELWQIVILTPDLNRAQAAAHLERVWKILVGYVTRMKGEPTLAAPLPDLDSLEVGPAQLTHFWSLPGLEVRVMVGRRDVDRIYVGAWFSDPVRGAVAREAYQAAVARSDALLRQQHGSSGAKGKP